MPVYALRAAVASDALGSLPAPDNLKTIGVPPETHAKNAKQSAAKVRGQTPNIARANAVGGSQRYGKWGSELRAKAKRCLHDSTRRAH